MMLAAEQARSMMLQTAQALWRADQQAPGAYALTRLLTPLIKFRACRDARKVTGDGMEVRGGCGYIEEWGDARIVRDAHLGSIWEGTSNIVALDVVRAIRREGSLPVWRAHLDELIAQSAWHAQWRTVLQDTCQRVQSMAQDIANDKSRENQTRQIASAMYRLTAAVAMGWEATQTGSMRRMLLAQLTLVHQLLPQDPLRARVQPSLDALFAPSHVQGDVSTVNLLATE
jgi:acyl-CoA dehydrogenase